MEERRQFVRWQVNRRARVELQNQDNPFDCGIDDISFKGLKIRSPQELKKDDNLRLSIALVPELSLNIEAYVVWNNIQGRDNISGLYFTKIKDTDKEKIYEFVRKNVPEQIKQQVWKGIV